MVIGRNIRILSLLIVALFFSIVELGAQEKPVLTLKRVVIDAGHGGHDPGTVWGSIREKDINLDVAVRLGAMIKAAYPNVKVIFTRDKDVYIPLDERSNIANKNKADLFISIHVNAMPGKTTAYGSETYLMGTDKAGKNMNVCKLENSVILLEDDYSTKYAGYDPDSPDSFIFFNLMQSAQFEQSVLMASLVEKELVKGPIGRSRGIRQAPLLVLWQTTMPSVLVELGFLSDSRDREILIDRQNRATIARCLFNAFSEFKKQYEIQGEKPAVDMSVLNSNVEDEQVNVEPSSAPVVKKEAPVVKKEEKKEEKKVEKKPEEKPVVKKESPKVVTEDYTAQLSRGGKWRIQILAASKYLKQSDPFFKGFKADCKMIGDRFYYFTGLYDSRAEAVENLPSIKEQFPGSFIVEFDNKGNPIK